MHSSADSATDTCTSRLSRYYPSQSFDHTCKSSIDILDDGVGAVDSGVCLAKPIEVESLKSSLEKTC